VGKGKAGPGHGLHTLWLDISSKRQILTLANRMARKILSGNREWDTKKEKAK